MYYVFCVSLIKLCVKVDLSVLKLFMLFNHHLLKEYFNNVFFRIAEYHF